MIKSDSMTIIILSIYVYSFYPVACLFSVGQCWAELQSEGLGMTSGRLLNIIFSSQIFGQILV